MCKEFANCGQREIKDCICSQNVSLLLTIYKIGNNETIFEKDKGLWMKNAHDLGVNFFRNKEYQKVGNKGMGERSQYKYQAKPIGQ